MTNEIIKQNASITQRVNTNSGLPVDIYEPFAFREEFKSKQLTADGILSKVADIINAAAEGDAIKKDRKKDFRYVVDMSDELKHAIEKGEIKLDYSKSGEVFAQIRDASGHFGDKLPIKKELITAGINPMELSQALQMKAIEDKLNDIMDTLEDIGQDVQDVLRGQTNDRIGLYNSGLNLYLESKNIQEPGFKMLVTSQALKSLSDGNEQLMLELRTNMDYLLEGKYKEKKGRSAEEIQGRMNDINKSFDIIHRSYKLKSFIYYENGEIPAMLSVFDEYRRFLNRNIVPNAPRLIEFDRSDKLLQNGKWETRSNMFEELGELKQRLSENKVFYLGTGE